MVLSPESRPQAPPSHIPPFFADRPLAEKIATNLSEIGLGKVKIVPERDLDDVRPDKIFALIEEPNQRLASGLSTVVIFNEMFAGALALRDDLVREGKTSEEIQRMMKGALDFNKRILEVVIAHEDFLIHARV